MRWRSSLFLLSMVAAACDVPTGLPKWNPTFAVPLQPISIPLAQLLPAGVQVTPDGGAFLVSLPPVGIQATLSQLCAACGALDGQTVPKPAFMGGSTARLPLPPDVVTASFTGGAVRFAITNGWNFDPLRPGPNQFGSLVLRPAAQPIDGGSAVITGQTRGLSPATTLVESVPITPASLQSLPVETHLASPAGDVVRIDAQAVLSMTVTPVDLTASSMTVQVGQRQVTSQQVQIDLTGVDDFIMRRVNGGMLVLTIANGFGVAGNLTLTLSGGTTTVAKSFELQTASTTTEVMLTEAEVESILGRSVTASLTGLTSANNRVVLMPGSTFTVEWLLVIEMGANAL